MLKAQRRQFVMSGVIQAASIRCNSPEKFHAALITVHVQYFIKFILFATVCLFAVCGCLIIAWLSSESQVKTFQYLYVCTHVQVDRTKKGEFLCN